LAGAKGGGDQCVGAGASFGAGAGRICFIIIFFLFYFRSEPVLESEPVLKPTPEPV